MSTVPRQKPGVRARRFTKREYYRMAELGFFHGQRVELIEGRLMVLSPQHAAHWSATERARARLALLFGIAYLVRMQGPIDLGQTTEPEPDIAVVLGTLLDFINVHPTTAALIVEVSDSTLSYDRNRKASLYACAGIRDYWIVNLVDNQLEVYRDPIPDAGQHHGFRYDTRIILAPGATVSPLALPAAVLPVADLFA